MVTDVLSIDEGSIVIILLMNTSSLIGMISQNKHYESHRRKVETIMTKSSHSLSFRKNNPFNNFHSSKDRAYRYSLKTKQEAVEKENNLILRKIIDVNRRSQSQTLPTAPKKDLSHNGLSSLKRKIQKTNVQNQKLASKLVQATSKLGQIQMNDDYRRHNQIKQRLKKYTFDQDTGMVVPKHLKSLVKLSKLQSVGREGYSSRVYE